MHPCTRVAPPSVPRLAAALASNERRCSSIVHSSTTARVWSFCTCATIAFCFFFQIACSRQSASSCWGRGTHKRNPCKIVRQNWTAVFLDFSLPTNGFSWTAVQFCPTLSSPHLLQVIPPALWRYGSVEAIANPLRHANELFHNPPSGAGPCKACHSWACCTSQPQRFTPRMVMASISESCCPQLVVATDEGANPMALSSPLPGEDKVGQNWTAVFLGSSLRTDIFSWTAVQFCLTLLQGATSEVRFPCAISQTI